MTRWWLIAALLLAAPVFATPVSAQASASAETKKKRKKKWRKKKARKKKKADATSKKDRPVPKAAPVDSSKAPPRKRSNVIPGAPSRWSNAGAMEPIMAQVPISAPLPERARPVAAGVQTPRQQLTGEEGQLSAYLSLGAYHLETVRQDLAYFADRFAPANRDVDLFRGRARITYRRIAGTWFSAEVDLDYRARSAGSRPTDRRLNAASVSWGLTDFRDADAPRFGVALGRVAVREAGYAHADGAHVRFRAIDSLHLGLFGGVSGNPYRYNWRAHETQDFSADWITGGLYAAFRESAIFANLAGVVWASTRGDGGLDRVALYVDAGWAPMRDLDVFLTGWVDVLPDGRPIQNLELIGAWRPEENTYLRLSVGRHSTLRYDISTPLSFVYDPTGNRVQVDDATLVAVDEDGVPIQPYDAALQVATYNVIRLRGGHRFGFGLEPFANVEVMIRDTTDAPFAPNFGAVRVLPSAGLGYRDPKIVDGSLRVIGVIDDQSDTDVVVQASLSRGFWGFRVGADARVFIGEVFAADGGFESSYTFTADWLPGRLMIRAMFRYFREDVALPRPIDEGIINDPNLLPLVPLQESFMGYAGVDYRL